jgi:ubiquinone/menaquinone biosynthesis C-methylase UbiE
MNNENPFNLDAQSNQGYLYSTNASLSSKLANQRLTDITLESIQFVNKNVIDIGCGDGTYTIEIYDRGNPSLIIANDIAEKAVHLACGRSGQRNIRYQVNSAYEIPFGDGTFDIAILRGVLHHLDDPRQAIQEALRVADTVWVIEPNGYNPGLKFLEKFSRYHIDHQEKSYAPASLDKWVESLGGYVAKRAWVGFVPMFCPPWMARIMKAMEPIVEKTPLLNRIGCAVYSFEAQHKLVT